MKPAMFDRDGYALSVIEKEVLGKGRRALLFFVFFTSANPGFGQEDRRRSNSSFLSLNPWCGMTTNTAPGCRFSISTVLPPGTFSIVGGGVRRRPRRLGDLAAVVAYPSAKKTRILTPDGGSMSGESLYEGVKFQDMADAYLYLGPIESVVIDGTIPPEVQQDEGYQRELQLRRSLLGRQ